MLFDKSRDPDEQVRPDDWHPDSSWAELDAHDTVGGRREWFQQLVEEGRL